MPREKYGLQWKDNIPDLHIELGCFRMGGSKGMSPNATEDTTKAFHFKNIVKMLWGKSSKKEFVWNPWNEKMLAAACEHKRVAFCGSGSSGKTFFMAAWGLVNWLCAPQETLVLFTSTSLEDSRRRIWGDVESLFMAACDKDGKPFLPGKLTSSIGKIRTAEGGVKYSDKCGLQLIPGDRAKEKDNIGKLIGAKNKRVLLMGDEFPELSPALTEAAEGNLMLNPYFQMIVSGNFKGLYDPFGLFVEPTEGWSSITPEFEEWLIKGGLALRFDGIKSPNVIAGFEKYPGIYKLSHLREHESHGVNSSMFWRMCRSYPCQNADVDRIWSDADLLKGDCHNNTVRWKEEPTDVAALDPAFVNGGDDAVQTFGKYGTSIENKKVLLITEQSAIPDDVRNKTDNRSVQVAKKFRDNCIRRGIKPENAAYDISGGGVVFGGLLGEVWSPKLLGVQFGGAASERPASAKDKRPSKDAFSNRVAELWFAGVDFAQSGQIKGLSSKCCTELTERRVKDRIKSATGMKVQIESKKEMKARTSGKSPDCFIAGTMVLTPFGEKPIESLKIGDVICTPFGNSPIFAIHCSETTELTKMVLSSGRSLIGKGKHKIFTWDEGWKRMDTILLTNKVESATNLPIWNILNSLFTKVGNTGFKALVDTIRTADMEKMSRKDFYTELSGLSTTAQFLMVMLSITKTAIGQIIQSAIWSLWHIKNTAKCTISNLLKPIQSGLEKLVQDWKKQELQPFIGISLQKAWNGTEKTVITHGIAEKKSCYGQIASCVERDAPQLPLNRAFTVAKNVAKRITEKINTETQKESVWCAIKNLLRSGLLQQKLAVLAVGASSVERTCVYNLTLEQHNAYYANGVLVANCADSAIILLELCRERLGFRAVGMENTRAEMPRQKQDRKRLLNRLYESVTHEYAYADA